MSSLSENWWITKENMLVSTLATVYYTVYTLMFSFFPQDVVLGFSHNGCMQRSLFNLDRGEDDRVLQNPIF